MSENINEYRITSGKSQLKFFDKIIELRKQVWPDFIRLDKSCVYKIYNEYADFQFSLFDKENNELVAIANSLPVCVDPSAKILPDDGLSWVFNEAFASDTNTNASMNSLCAISITISESYRNKGISKILLNHLKFIAAQNFSSLIVPVRPNLKKLYPLTPIDNYTTWKDRNGRVFDPWLRTHIELGAELLNICHRSACITATVEQWEKWTGLVFPAEGIYIIKDALMPLEINFSTMLGHYIEPNIWVKYAVNQKL